MFKPKRRHAVSAPRFVYGRGCVIIPVVPIRPSRPKHCKRPPLAFTLPFRLLKPF